MIRADAQWEIVGVSDLSDGCRATPAIAGAKMYVRTFGMLYCFADRR